MAEVRIPEILLILSTSDRSTGCHVPISDILFLPLILSKFRLGFSTELRKEFL